MPIKPITLDGVKILQPKPLLIVISGPSGVGKDSVLKALKERQLPLHFVVTATSRASRKGEVDGVDYFFVSHQEFKRMIAEEELLEYSLVYQDYKGIPKSQIRKAFDTGNDVILRVDVQGAGKVRAICPEAILIYISPGSEEELYRRLTSRQSESDASMTLRLQTAREELARLSEFDYLVINTQDHLEDAVDQIIMIINSEHLKVHPREVNL
jgi:guanylate kinase